MLYRKAPPTPPRLLLRIVATVGAGALLGMAGCASSSSNGVGPNPPTDAADEALNLGVDGGGADLDVFMGLVGDATLPCGGGPCGSVALPPDGGDAGGLLPDADADASPVDASFDGSDASVDSPDAIAHCGGVCGVIVHVDE
jgi:hypothetical protein